MNWETYLTKFEDVLENRNTNAPYDNLDYVEFVKLNNSRMNRWNKRGQLTEDMKATLDALDGQQKWVLITEPWCGDAAHLAPFIAKVAEYSPKIDLEIQLRDSEGSEIDNYLTNGGKAMPKLIVRNSNNEDLFTWGARPKEATELVQKQKTTEQTAEEKKAELQMWYNKDKGVAIQKELKRLIEAV